MPLPSLDVALLFDDSDSLLLDCALATVVAVVVVDVVVVPDFVNGGSVTNTTSDALDCKINKNIITNINKTRSLTRNLFLFATCSYYRFIAFVA